MRLGLKENQEKNCYHKKLLIQKLGVKIYKHTEQNKLLLQILNQIVEAKRKQASKKLKGDISPEEADRR